MMPLTRKSDCAGEGQPHRAGQNHGKPHYGLGAASEPSWAARMDRSEGERRGRRPQRPARGEGKPHVATRRGV